MNVMTTKTKQFWCDNNFPHFTRWLSWEEQKQKQKKNMRKNHTQFIVCFKCKESFSARENMNTGESLFFFVLNAFLVRVLDYRLSAKLRCGSSFRLPVHTNVHRDQWQLLCVHSHHYFTLPTRTFYFVWHHRVATRVFIKFSFESYEYEQCTIRYAYSIQDNEI